MRQAALDANAQRSVCFFFYGKCALRVSFGKGTLRASFLFILTLPCDILIMYRVKEVYYGNID